MASTGVSVSDNAVAKFTEFKKSSNSIKFIVFKIEGPEIVVEHESDSSDFDAFIQLLPANDCRYAIYKMDFTTNDGRPGTKLASISWCDFYFSSAVTIL